ncbi:MAG: bifunctional adenosylcobinamide kinase/adenosylcobinamide-phosphate guanylyltransferase [Synergistaceae bacterium]|jgi:adenosyl cobinamide kinase/adenosyl cobinamide phosphate guanylyltransferase|nr:bifunctional adenosylcobinamide kinase/adenosylcobinamide-phosphate guanylyltransferase [Synergistaceae bacterium]
MHLIIGGKYMGKLEYAKKLYGEDVSVCDLGTAAPEEMFEARVVVNLQEGARSLLKKGESVREFFELNLGVMKGTVLIGDEIGGGIVPVDPFERLWRDETGFLYQMLASRADIVDRIWAGLPSRLKG